MKKVLYLLIAVGLLIELTAQAHRRYGTARLIEMTGIDIPIRERKVEVEKIIEVPQPKLQFEDALARRLENSDVPRVLVEGILVKEDGSRSNRMSLTRFETSYMDTARSITRNPDEQRMWASSWCPFQIMAPHARSYKLDWADLLEPETCVHVGMSILEDCWRKARGRTKLERVYNTGICYNGPKGQAYADHLVKLVSQAAIEEIL